MIQNGIKGNHFLVTGAAGLIGSAICKALVKLEAKVTLIDINLERLKLLNSELLALGGKTYINHSVNLLDKSEVTSMLNQSEAQLGAINGLVHAAYPRTSDWGLKFEKIPVESWNRNVEDHLTSTFCLCQTLGERLVNNKNGKIVLFSSIYGLQGPDFTVYEDTPSMTMPAAYSAIKGGVTNFTRYLASYWGNSGVRVNAVCPGGIFDNQDTKFVAAYSKKVPMKRLGEVDEVVGPVLFLLSDLSTYMTGVNLPIDGGWTAT